MRRIRFARESLSRRRRSPRVWTRDLRLESLEDRRLLAILQWSGTLPANTVWRATDLHRITTDVTVAAGSTLTIEAGAIVKFDPGRSMDVQGKLLAPGTAESPIVFTSRFDDSVGEDAGGTPPFFETDGFWKQIRFTATSTESMLDHVDVRRGGRLATGMIVIEQGDLTLTNSRLEKSLSSGVRIERSEPVLHDLVFQDVGYNPDGDPRNTLVLPAAISMDLESDPDVRGFASSGVLASNGEATAYHGLLLDDGTITGQRVWNDPDVVYVLAGEVTVADGATLEVRPGQIIKGGGRGDLDRLIVEGRLRAVGTVEAPIQITNLADDSVGGDTDGVSEPLVDGFAWAGIEIRSRDPLNRIEHAVLKYGAIVRVQGGQLVLHATRHEATVLAVDAGGELSLTSSIIHHGQGVGVYGGSEATLVNNTIADNPVGGFQIGSSTATLVNNLITNNRQDINRFGNDHHLQMFFNDIFNVDPSSRFGGGSGVIGTNGNISVDPRYINAAGGNYRLRPGSPAIDAGTSDNAPLTDHGGQPRFDHPGITNRGAGSSPFFDLGAWESQGQVTSDVDLQTDSASGPATGLQDQQVVVQWSVTNHGTGPATANWHDGIFLSTDTVWTADDVLVAEIPHVGGLGPNQSYTSSATVTLPGVLPGDYYLLVQTDVRTAEFEEPLEGNNGQVAPTMIHMSLPVLELGVPLTAEFPAGQTARFYEVVTPAFRDLRITTPGDKLLHVAFADLPSVQSFDGRAIEPGLATHEVVIPRTSAGSYYVMISRAPTGSAGFTLTASLANLTLASVAPQQVQSQGRTTLTLRGTGLHAPARPRLMVAGGAMVEPTEVFYHESGELAATFDLHGAPVGAATVEVVLNNVVVASLPGGVEVLAGARPGELEFDGRVFDIARASRSFPLTLTYRNVGGADLVAPLMQVTAEDNAVLSFHPDMRDAGPRLSVLLTSRGAAPGVLAPGESGEIELYGLATEQGSESFELKVTAHPEQIDWEQFGASLRPAELTDAAWAALLARIRANLGETWAQARQVLARDASLLPATMGVNHSLRHVLRLEYIKAAAELSPALSGIAFLNDATQRLGNAIYQLRDDVTGEILTGVTWNDGTILLPDIVPGTYALSFENYIALPTAPLVLTDSDRNGVEWFAQSAASFSGTVRAREGVLLRADQPVRATSAAGETFSTLTGLHGSYELGGLPSGTYEIDVGAPPYATRMTTLTLAAGAVRRNVDFALDIGGQIPGTVTGPNGPVADATLTARNQDGEVVAVVPSNPQGQFAFVGLASGFYDISASAPGFAEETRPAVLAIEYDVSPALAIQLVPGGRLVGTVKVAATDLPLAGALITVAAGARQFTDVSDGDGHFVLEGLPAGNQTVQITYEDAMTHVASFVSVLNGETMVDAALVDRGQVSGQVTRGNSTDPVRKVVVQALREGEIAQITTTDDQGHYTLAGLDAGQYQIVLGDEGSPGIKRGSVTISPQARTATLDFTLDVAGIVSGRTLAADGSPIENALVALVQNGVQLVTMPSEADGDFVFVVLAAGTYELEAVDGQHDFAPRTGVVVGGGNTVSGLDLQAGSESLVSVVRDQATGLPLEGVSVRLYSGDTDRALNFITDGVTDPAGALTFTGLRPGSYRLFATFDERAPAVVDVTVTAGNAGNVALALTTGEVVSGVVRDAVTNAPLPGARIEFVRSDPTFLRYRSATNQLGNYRVAHLPAGTYTVIVTHSDHTTTIQDGVVVAAGERTFDVTLSRTEASLRGTVTNGVDPLAGALVVAHNAAGHVVARTFTDDAGTYLLSHVPLETLELRYAAAGYFRHVTTGIVPEPASIVENTTTVLSAVAVKDFELTDDGKAVVNDARDSKVQGISRLLYDTDITQPLYRLNAEDQEFLASTPQSNECKALIAALLQTQSSIKSSQAALGAQRDLLGQGLTLARMSVLSSLNGMSLLSQILSGLFSSLRGIVDGFGLFSDDDAPNHIESIRELRELFSEWALATGDFGLPADYEDALIVLNEMGAKTLSFMGWASGVYEGLRVLAGLAEAEPDEFGIDADSGDLEGSTDGNTATLMFAVEVFGFVLERATIVHFNIIDLTTLTSKLGVYESARRSLGRQLNVFEQTLRQARAFCTSCESAPQRSPLLGAEGEGGSGTLPECEPEPEEPQEPEDPGDPNHPGGSRRKRLKTQVGAGWDPNDKLGPAAFGDDSYLAPGAMPYRILFENDPAAGATLSAQEVVVRDSLDPNFDLGTFEFTSFGFAEREFAVPPGLSFYQTIIEHQVGNQPLLVSVELSLDALQRLVTARFRTLDTNTLRTPDDPTLGFLPVNNKQLHNGEGFVGFVVSMLDGVPDRTLFSNRASIVFDANPPILTPTRRHRVDGLRPSSAVLPLPSESEEQFVVSWAGADGLGSGIATYDLYVSDNGGPYTRLLSASPDTSYSFTGQDGHSYAFFSLATDLVGWRESLPTVADATTLVAGGSWHNARYPLDVTADTSVAPVDALLIVNELNQRRHSAADGRLIGRRGTSDGYLDVTGDGIVAPLDALLVINFLNFGPGGEGEAPVVGTPAVPTATGSAVPAKSRPRVVATAVLPPLTRDESLDDLLHVLASDQEENLRRRVRRR